MELTDIINSGKLIKERVEYIFTSFQKEFSNIRYEDRGSILGIGEPNHYLLCYFKKIDNGEILVKFKSAKKAISLLDDIENIDTSIRETIKTFKTRNFSKKGKSLKRKEYCIKNECDEVGSLVKEIVLTKGEVIISEVASYRLYNALSKRQIYKIADLLNWSEKKLNEIPFFGKTCYKELINILLFLIKESLGVSDNYVGLLFLKFTYTDVYSYENKEEIVAYLTSINYDYNRFNFGTLGWVLCLKNKLQQNVSKLVFCKDEEELRKIYNQNKDKCIDIFEKTKETLSDLINKTTVAERDVNLVFTLLSFFEKKHTLREVGDTFGVSGERARQIYKRTKKDLLRSLKFYSFIGLVCCSTFNNYLSNFSDLPLDCFLLYLKAEKNKYVYDLFVSLFLNFNKISYGTERMVEYALTNLNKKEFQPIITIPMREVIEIIIKGIEEICKVNYFGITVITRVLKGDNDKKLLRYQLNKLNCYGALKNVKRDKIVGAINYLINNKVLYVTDKFRPVVKVSLDTTFEERNNLDLSELENGLSVVNVETECAINNGKNFTIKELTAKDVLKKVLNACIEISEVYFFGTITIKRVLIGSRSQKVLKYKLDKLNCYGSLSSLKGKDVADIIDFLIEEKFLYKTVGTYPTVRVNKEKTIEELDNIDLSTIEEILLSYNVEDNKQETIKVKEDKVVIDGYKVFVDENGEILTDMQLFELLRKLRKVIGDENNIHYYMVAWDKVLIRLATEKPRTKEEFLSINGVGKKWYDSYGVAFLDLINSYLDKQIK